LIAVVPEVKIDLEIGAQSFGLGAWNDFDKNFSAFDAKAGFPETSN